MSNAGFIVIVATVLLQAVILCTLSVKEKCMTIAVHAFEFISYFFLYFYLLKCLGP